MSGACDFVPGVIKTVKWIAGIIIVVVILIFIAINVFSRVMYICDRCEIKVASWQVAHYCVGTGFIRKNFIKHHFCKPCELIYDNLMKFPTNTMLLGGGMTELERESLKRFMEISASDAMKEVGKQ